MLQLILACKIDKWRFKSRPERSLFISSGLETCAALTKSVGIGYHKYGGMLKFIQNLWSQHTYHLQFDLNIGRPNKKISKY